MTMEPDYARLATAIVAARKARGWTQQKKFVTDSGLGNSTVQRLEKGAPDSPYPTKRTIDTLEQMLGWGAGSVVSILSGGDPLPAHATAARSPAEDSFVKELRQWPGLSADMRDRLIAAYLENRAERIEQASQAAERLVRPLAEAASREARDDRAAYPESDAS